jgi:hypothetical protein
MKKRMVMIANGPRNVWPVAGCEAGTAGGAELLLHAIARVVRTGIGGCVQSGDEAAGRLGLPEGDPLKNSYFSPLTYIAV